VLHCSGHDDRHGTLTVAKRATNRARSKCIRATAGRGRTDGRTDGRPTIGTKRINRREGGRSEGGAGMQKREKKRDDGLKVVVIDRDLDDDDNIIMYEYNTRIYMGGAWG